HGARHDPVARPEEERDEKDYPRCETHRARDYRVLNSPMPFATAAGRSINYQWVGPETSGKPTLVFLHEGLGSIGQWRDFPAKVAAATGCRALAYDRYGYGQSDVLAEKQRSVRFMHDEALSGLPDLLRELAIERPI